MPRSNGVYSPPPNSLAVPGDIIRSAPYNGVIGDMSQALTDSVPRDGSAAMTGDLPMAGRKVTGLGPATAPGDAVRFDQAVVRTGWLGSVSQLTFTADSFPYATSPTASAVTSLTLFGRQWLSSADKDAASDLLGLDVGAFAPDQTQAIWNSGESIEESVISPFKLDAAVRTKIDFYAFAIKQIWVNVTGSRATNVEYQNSTPRSIMVSITGNRVDFDGGRLEVRPTTSAAWIVVGKMVKDRDPTFGSDYGGDVSTIVPSGWYYRFGRSNDVIQSWAELR